MKRLTAIKSVFRVPAHVDLVLFTKRPEEFQFLRGGPDFVENSARINRFFSEFPATRAAVIAVKTPFKKRRPKGIVLAAIAWRLAENFPLTRMPAGLAEQMRYSQHFREKRPGCVHNIHQPRL